MLRRPSLLLLGALGACHGSSASPDAEEVIDCTTVQADTFVIGLDKPGTAGMLDFKLMAASPAPPAQGNNTWTVKVSTMAGGTAVPGATIQVTPYMPAHMHTSPIKATVTDKGDGTYTLAPVNLWMPGVWETTLQVTSPSGADSAMFRFCIPN